MVRPPKKKKDTRNSMKSITAKKNHTSFFLDAHPVSLFLKLKKIMARPRSKIAFKVWRNS
jgi:hypothetical protein